MSIWFAAGAALLWASGVLIERWLWRRWGANLNADTKGES